MSLQLVNRGSFEHSFTAPAFFASTEPRPGTTRPADGEVTLKAGESRTIDVTPTRTGTYGVDCTEPLRAVMGMRGKITVAN